MPHDLDATLRFYRDVLGMAIILMALLGEGLRETCTRFA
jgi:catechol 2,3-dioxygenase-like lactoylglutathione lyase family enzyme